MAASTIQNSGKQIKIEGLGKLVRKRRRAERLTLEEVAKQTGISASTLSRLERQYENEDEGSITPDTRTVTAVATWLGISVDRFFGFEESQQTQKNTPDLVEAYLRADRNLAPEAAENLGRMFRIAYDQFAKTSSESNPTLPGENNK